jgi:histidinol-phosphatase
LTNGKFQLDRTAAPAFTSLLKFAHELADRSGKIILPHFRKAIPVDNKAGRGRFDPVTAADRKAEQAIDRLIAREFPDHAVNGEEYGARGRDARYRWHLDPIDGTRSFITGVPTWGTLIGLTDNETPLLGLMDQPYTGERFWSAKSASQARTAQGKVRRIETRTCPRLSEAFLMTTCPDLFAAGDEREAFERIKRETRMIRYSADCYAYCLLASGFVDLVVETGLKPHDIIALIPIIERSGGVITTWDGEPATAGGRIVAAGDPTLHARALKLLTA